MGVTYYLTNSEHINDIDVTLGNLIFSEDNNRIYFDGNMGRVCYDSIMVFATEAERYNYPVPLEGFYFVSETKILWRYEDNAWTAITEPPTNNVVFIPKSELPTEGAFATLYVCGTEMYVWVDNQYVPMNADSIWREV